MLTRFFRQNAIASLMAGGAIAVSAGMAQAGGLAIREQSTQFQGSSFAGNAAGGGLSSMFWNSAALGEAGAGIWTDSSYSLILGRTKFSDVELNGVPGPGADQDGTALVAGSYFSYRLSDKFVVGMAVNSPFGLSSKVDNQDWGGRFHHRSSKLITVNANPMASYEIRPGLFIGAGVQIQYADLKFKTSAGGPNAALLGDDIGFGFTAGLLWKPSRWTSIGLGYRSKIDHKIEGDFRVVGVPGTRAPFDVSLATPETVTLSFRQALSEHVRLLGSVEWANWDRFSTAPVNSTSPALAGGEFDFRYSDGWFFSLGGEFDYSDRLTFRAGLAYEISPVDDPTKRLAQIPDADRIWLSAGLTYQLTPTTSLNFAYTHIFVDDARLDRFAVTPVPPLRLTADVESSIDIISVGYKMKFDWFDRTAYTPLK